MRKNMRAERARSGMTVDEIASKVGVSKIQVYRWEHGTQEPMAGNIIKLASIYGCSVDYLMGLTDDRHGQEVAPEMSGHSA